MAILSKLFTPKWQHKDPSVRRRGLQSFSSDKQRISFIEHESEAELINEAVALLSNDSLQQLSRHANSSIVQPVKKELLTRLLDNGQLPQTAETTVYIDIAALTDDQNLRLQAVKKIEDEDACLRLAIEHPVAKVRLAAAGNIQTQDKITQLSQQSQGKDKSVYRLCKDKLGNLRQLAEQQQQLTDAITKCSDQLKTLVKQGYGPDFFGRLQVIQNNWLTLSDQAEMLIKQDIEELLKQANQCLDQQRQLEEQKRQQEQHEKLVTRQRQEIIESSEQDLQTFSQLNWCDLIQSDESTAPTNQMYQSSWQKLEAEFNIPPQQQQAWSQLNEDWQVIDTIINLVRTTPKLADWIIEHARQAESDTDQISATPSIKPELLRQIQWPTRIAPPNWLIDLQKTLKQAQKKSQKKQSPTSVKQADQTSLNQLIAEIEQALDQGQAKQAAALLRQMNQNINPRHSGKSLTAQINRLKGRLQELRDWQGFATTPKQINLCEQMEALITADKDPEQLAADIKALQQQWKDLGGSGGEQELWQRFQNAANTAYIPCQQFYDEQAVLRQQRVDARNDLIAQLTEYETGLDWQHADWKMVQHTLSSARQSFRSLAPVDRQQHKITSEAMDAVCDRIYSHLKEEYERNLAKLKLLVGRAEAQCSNDDLQQATATVKQLQQDWKAVGVTPRNADQPLWKQFRQYCDAVFGRLEQQRQQRKQTIEQDITTAETILSELTAESVTLSLSAIQEKVEVITDSISQLTLPKQVEQKLQKQIQRLVHDAEQRRRDEKENAKQQSWASLIDLLEHNSDEPSMPDIIELPSGFDSSELKAAYIPSETEMTAEADKALQTLCVQIEILAEIESPQQASDIRMQLQVERLAQGIGKQLPLADQRKQIILQWLSLAGRSAYTNRFVTALRQII